MYHFFFFWILFLTLSQFLHVSKREVQLIESQKQRGTNIKVFKSHIKTHTIEYYQNLIRKNKKNFFLSASQM